MKKNLLILASLFASISLSCAVDLGKYNVVWNTPSKDPSGVMPIGNGDIAAGVYAIEGGDLFVLLAKNDAYNYEGDIFKTGRVRISLDPNPFQAGKPFRQTLDVVHGSVRIEADGVSLCVWADANRPVYHVQVDAPQAIALKVRPDLWERFDNIKWNIGIEPSAKKNPATQDVLLERDGRLLWYFAVGDRSVYPGDAKYYGFEEAARRFPDPFRYNTFGNLLESPDLRLEGGALTGKRKSFDVRIHALSMQTPKSGEWIDAMQRQAARPVDAKADWEKHCAWWQAFWDRGWITASDNSIPEESREQLLGEAPSGRRTEKDGAAIVAQSYNVFRYIMACQSRGRVQAKFNGGLFTQALRVEATEYKEDRRTLAAKQPDGSWLTHVDDRLWGRRFTFQNQRLLYWPLLASGDFDLMKPFFEYYVRLLPIRKAITKTWFGHEGAYFRENIEPTGAERDCGRDGRPPRTKPAEADGYYHDYYFTSGLETTAMMLDFVNHTGDSEFRDTVLVPFAREVLRFFDKHYARGADGKLRIDPGQVLETWWNSVNPSPDIAGLRFCLDGLLAMKAGDLADLEGWRKLRAELPEVPMRTIEGRQAIAPAEIWERKKNAENGELYPVFPFRCFGLADGSSEVVDWTTKNRTVKDAFQCACWTQDQIDWAYAGNAAEAAQGLVTRFRTASTLCRFPLYGKEGPDSCPDFDHFGSGAIALQRMLVQEAGEKIVLLPAWPAAWDADFKLHLAGRTVIAGTVKAGKLVRWEISRENCPESKKSKVTVCQPQPSTSVPLPK